MCGRCEAGIFWCSGYPIIHLKSLPPTLPRVGVSKPLGFSRRYPSGQGHSQRRACASESLRGVTRVGRCRLWRLQAVVPAAAPVRLTLGQQHRGLLSARSRREETTYVMEGGSRPRLFMLSHSFTRVNTESSASSEKVNLGQTLAVSTPRRVKEANHERTQVLKL
jgi:hypothetical protein